MQMNDILPTKWLPTVALALITTVTLLPAQRTITHHYMPSVNDTFFIAVDNLPISIKVQEPGPAKRWDFSSLQAPYARVLVLHPAKKGRAATGFSQADVVIEDSGEEFYYNIGSTEFQLMGYFGKDPLNLGVKDELKFSPPLVERKLPVKYKDSRESKHIAEITIPAGKLPKSALQQLPLRPDSLRIKINIHRKYIVDAWGATIIPGGIYDVLREKRTEIKEIQLEAKTGKLGWQNIGNLLQNALPAIGKHSSVEYHFHSEESLETIAVVKMKGDTEAVETVLFKANYQDGNLPLDSDGRPGLYVYPNPAIFFTRLEFANLPAGNYSVAIFNLLGIEIWRQTYEISGPKTERIDISHFRKGAYLYSLIDERGKTLSTKRLVIMKP